MGCFSNLAPWLEVHCYDYFSNLATRLHTYSIAMTTSVSLHLGLRFIAIGYFSNLAPWLGT